MVEGERKPQALLTHDDAFHEFTDVNITGNPLITCALAYFIVYINVQGM